MNRLEKIRFLERIKSGKIRFEKNEIALFTGSNLSDEILCPNGQITNREKAELIAKNCEKFIFLITCYGKKPGDNETSKT